MPSRDAKNTLAVVQLLDPQSINNTDTASAWLDTRGFQSALLLLTMGALTGADADSTYLPVLQESDTTVATDATTVAAGDVQGAFTLVDATTEDQATQSVGYKGNRRYVRVNLDFTTGTGGITAALQSIVGVLGRSSSGPPVAPAAVAAT